METIIEEIRRLERQVYPTYKEKFEACIRKAHLCAALQHLERCLDNANLYNDK